MTGNREMTVMENIHFHSVYLALVSDEEELKLASLLNIRLGNADVFKIDRGKKSQNNLFNICCRVCSLPTTPGM